MHPLSRADLWLGVVAGLASAFFSAISYLVSRHHATRQPARGRHGAALRLLTASHLVMAAVCLPLVWWLWPPEMSTGPAAVFAILPPLAGSLATYILGQTTLYAALDRAEASRVAPLLGLKIVVLAFTVTLALGQVLDGQQWLAVGLSVVAAFFLQTGRGAVPLRVLGLVLVGCVLFAASDLQIVRLIAGIQAEATAAGAPLSRMHAGALAMVITFATCGLLFLPVAAAIRPRGDWAAATAYAAAWLASMISLYYCFGTVGAVFGNIIQSTRGLMAVALGALLARRGWHELEQRVDRATLLRRVFAAALMTVAIALYAVDLS